MNPLAIGTNPLILSRFEVILEDRKPLIQMSFRLFE